MSLIFNLVARYKNATIKTNKMKYTISINQLAVVENKFPLTFSDVAILETMYSCFGSNYFNKTLNNGKIYTWVSYSIILDELPMLWKVTKENTTKQITKDWLSRKVSRLVDLGFLEKMQGSQQTGQTYYCSTPKLEKIISSNRYGEKTERTEKSPNPYGEKSHTPTEKSPYNNNTNYNTTNNNKEELSDFEKSNDVAGTPKEDILYNQFLEIFEYFKRVTGKKLKLRSTKSLVKRSDKYKYITKRLKEKFTVEDAKKVIDCKHAEWCDNPKMQKHITIQTIFSTKFEKYLDDAENTPNLSDNTQSGINTPKSKENATAFKLEGNELEAYKFLQQKVNDERFTPLVYSKCFNVQKLRRYTQHITRTDIAMRIKRGIIEWTKAYNKNELLSDIIMQEFSKR